MCGGGGGCGRATVWYHHRVGRFFLENEFKVLLPTSICFVRYSVGGGGGGGCTLSISMCDNNLYLE